MCVECAQTIVWPLRTDFLFRTAERDAAADKVQEHLESNCAALDALAAQKSELQDQLSRIKLETVSARNALDTDMTLLEKLKAENQMRRRRLEDSYEEINDKQGLLESVQRDIKRANQKWKLLYGRTAEARGFLCREAAGLHGLRLKRRRSGRVEYTIGGVVIPNLLTDLNVHAHTAFNVSLDHLAHLLVLVSHYLGLKLPHEIVLPARDNPFTSLRSVLNNRHLATRPLYTNLPLSTLSREDPSTHSKYIEGVSMLALDVAWLCYSQGLEINEVEDASNVGHCMWKLLVAKDSTASNANLFGRTSHATINGNLATAPGEAMMVKFKLRYNTIADRIRYTLQGETIVADWDLVPEAEGGSAKGAPDASNTRSPAGGDGEDVDETVDISSFANSNVPSSNDGVGRWTRIRARNDVG